MNEVDELAQITKKSFDQVDKQFIEVKQAIKAIRKELKVNQKVIINEFKVLAENIHQDVAGANQDKISLIEQKQAVLDKRLTRVEHKVGV